MQSIVKKLMPLVFFGFFLIYFLNIKFFLLNYQTFMTQILSLTVSPVNSGVTRQFFLFSYQTLMTQIQCLTC